MFEHDKATVDALLRNDAGFRRLYEKHSSINNQVDDAAAGDLLMEQLQLESLKKEKLLLADQMQAMIQAHQVAP